MRKPSQCAGCPFAGRGTGFVADKIPRDAKLVLIFDMPARNSDAEQADEVWDAKYFQQQFLMTTQLEHRDMGYMHLLRCREPNGAKGKDLAIAKDHCRRHDHIKEGAVVGAVGPLAWKYFGESTGSRKDWRGYYIENSDKVRDTSGVDDLPDGKFDVGEC